MGNGASQELLKSDSTILYRRGTWHRLSDSNGIHLQTHMWRETRLHDNILYTFSPFDPFRLLSICLIENVATGSREWSSYPYFVIFFLKISQMYSGLCQSSMCYNPPKNEKCKLRDIPLCDTSWTVLFYICFYQTFSLSLCDD